MTAAADPLADRLAALETGLVSDVLDEAGMPVHALSPSLLALIPGARMAGRAACVSGEAFLSTGHAAPALPGDALEQVAGAGTVLVIGAGGFMAGACIGGFVAYSLQRGGCRGVVTDGAIRDADEIRGLGFPVICAAVTPVNGARRWRLIRRDAPVQLPGLAGSTVAARPGDLILADGDGTIVLPAELAEQVIADAEELQRIERRIAEGLRAGGARADVFKANPRFAHIRRPQSGAG